MFVTLFAITRHASQWLARALIRPRQTSGPVFLGHRQHPDPRRSLLCRSQSPAYTQYLCIASVAVLTASNP